MPRRRKRPLELPDDSMPSVGVQVTVVTTDQGIAIDLDVKVHNGPPGLEATLGRALRPAAKALGMALAAALGGQVAERPYDEAEDLPTIAASRPGRS